MRYKKLQTIKVCLIYIYLKAVWLMYKNDEQSITVWNDTFIKAKRTCLKWKQRHKTATVEAADFSLYSKSSSSLKLLKGFACLLYSSAQVSIVLCLCQSMKQKTKINTFQTSDLNARSNHQNALCWINTEPISWHILHYCSLYEVLVLEDEIVRAFKLLLFTWLFCCHAASMFKTGLNHV